MLSLDHDGTDVSQLTMESGWHDFWFRMGFKSAIYFGVILFTRLNNFLAKLVITATAWVRNTAASQSFPHLAILC